MLDKPKISVIVCSRQSPEWREHERNIAQTIGIDYELIRIDNRNKEFSLCAAYNFGVQRARGDICVFVHEDVFFLEKGWGKVVMDKFARSDLACLGVAGGAVLLDTPPSWVSAGRPWIHGKVIHHNTSSNAFTLCAYGEQGQDTEVVAVDGLFFAIPNKLFPALRFDAETFDAFHCYDLDICLQARRLGTILVTEDILLVHQSGGHFDEVWQHYAQRLVEKYKGQFPITTSTSSYSGHPGPRFEAFDVTSQLAGLRLPCAPKP